ncbi:glucose-6-phosphate isomerase [Mangrovimonas yunxiaonensis]|uniref:Glucose-6-phosphate isomerase n=1 Tax=Mangrovimonas yunxiaonensis TaxID=1197477 RepID=A0A084TL52_9FLAO|nr:glucose-6-phosphate isomerase [Mangrovimonas yunxiaonensis]KFB01438.1 glucose-6-phosphate isomerase [Mangrovimonas yunxiaonensis]GGH36657.1 glucose-6-phosphate isomerase [Mangrovimonas yunxiaonensis]
MALPKINPTHTAAWTKLQAHFKQVENLSIKQMFAQDAARANNMSIRWEDFLVDFSKNRATNETLELLLELAKEVKLEQAIEAYFSGEKINETENRAVLHTALRANQTTAVFVDGKNVVPDIYAVKHKMKAFTNAVVNGGKTGYTGKPFTDVVNIGIGGSDLGPAMAVDTLKYYKNHLRTHFVSNVDGDHVAEILKTLNPETTLFVVVSKTFTTQETLTNAQTIKTWFLQSDAKADVAKHFVAVSTSEENPQVFGIDKDNIFLVWNWVGGRFSLWSAVGLTISLALGYDNFEKLLEGANKMDNHFKSASFNKNIPVVLAMLSVWYNNFFNAESEVVIPYSSYLNTLAKYLQQGTMESNGKSIDRNGEAVDYQTGTIIWGGPGTDSQHAFFQLFHQGTKLIPADFIGFVNALHQNNNHQDKLISNFLAQTEALLNGKTKAEAVQELEAKGVSKTEIDRLLPYMVFEGNKPTNTLFINKLTPESLGKLIALYEHKIFVQGVVWNIFSYDQFGVELGKQLAGHILKDFKAANIGHHDPSTQHLIAYYKALKS